jgi:hypothetical protein
MYKIIVALWALVLTIGNDAHATMLSVNLIEEMICDSDQIARVFIERVDKACLSCSEEAQASQTIAQLRVLRTYRGARREGEVIDLKQHSRSQWYTDPFFKAHDEGILFLKRGEQGYVAMNGYRGFQKIRGSKVETINFVDFPRSLDLRKFERRIDTFVCRAKK